MNCSEERWSHLSQAICSLIVAVSPVDVLALSGHGYPQCSLFPVHHCRVVPGFVEGVWGFEGPSPKGSGFKPL